METGSDPYTTLLQAFGGAGAEQANRGALRMFLGTVKRASPLEIDVNGTVQRAADGNIWCNPALVPGHTYDAAIANPTGTIRASVNCGSGGISQLTAGGSGTLSASLTLRDAGFSAGDRLVLLTGNQQTFYILCKEVQL